MESVVLSVIKGENDMLISILICVGVFTAIAISLALLLAVAEHFLQVNDDSEKHIEK